MVCEDMIRAFQQCDEERIIALSYKSAEECDYRYMDDCGMTVLHHAARNCMLEVAERIVETAGQDLVNAVTFTNRNPARWTPLQCLADTPCKPNRQDFALYVNGLWPCVTHRRLAFGLVLLYIFSCRV